MAATKTSVRVRGVTYSDPTDAYVAAEELEHHADTLAGQLRRNGKDAEAEQVQDRGHADAARLRAFAREREQAEAEQTDQPADRPTENPHPSRGRRRRASPARSRRRGVSTSRGRGGGFTPRTQQIVVQTGIPAAGRSASSLLLSAIGMSLGVAFLTILLTSRGVAAFSGLAGGVGRGLSWLIDTGDPLAPRPKPVAPVNRAASAAASSYARTVPLFPRLPGVPAGVLTP